MMSGSHLRLSVSKIKLIFPHMPAPATFPFLVDSWETAVFLDPFSDHSCSQLAHHQGWSTLLLENCTWREWEVASQRCRQLGRDHPSPVRPPWVTGCLVLILPCHLYPWTLQSCTISVRATVGLGKGTRRHVCYAAFWEFTTWVSKRNSPMKV